MQRIFCIVIFLGLMSCQEKKPAAVEVTETPAASVWTAEKANDWYSRQAWIAGANFIPSTAINQLEMWQAESFDTATIARELQWAQQIGFNTMRVYLHHKAWEIDSTGFLNRLDQYLGIAGSKGIKTIFVFFDDVWNKDPKTGVQPAPKPGTHNSGWLQDPGDPYSKDSTIFPQLEKYVKSVLGHLKNDSRVLLWDLYNEPGNSGKGETSLPLLASVFGWARQVDPSQPVSAGLWNPEQTAYNRFLLDHSDVITYHNYDSTDKHRATIDSLKKFGRPMICSEYMARTRGSKFSNIMPMLKENKVGAINWGLVVGKTNTIYAWDTPMPDGKEPPVWFHDIFRSKDGSPFDPKEIALIKSLTGK